MNSSQFNDLTDREEKAYSEMFRLGETALPRIEKTIKRALRSLGDRNLVRGKLIESRIKEPPSLRRKAGRHGWSFEDAVLKASDFVGCRIVCNNVQDVFRISDLLEHRLQGKSVSIRREDYIASPTEDGYRALHLLLILPVRFGNDKADLHLEFQIRSLLQDGWARLSRDDIYTSSSEIPPSILNRMKSLSKTLEKADRTADSLRTLLAKPRKGRRPVGGQKLTTQTLAFVYRRTFGEDPPEYLVQGAIAEYGAYEIRADGLENALNDESLRRQLVDAYGESGLDPDASMVLSWILLSMVQGREVAIRRARRDGQEEWAYIDGIATRHMLDGLPEDPESLVWHLEQPVKDVDPQADLEMWASGLGATSRCDRCGETLIDSYGFVEAYIRKLKFSGKRAEDAEKKILEAVIQTGAETGDGGLCSYCAHMWSKF